MSGWKKGAIVGFVLAIIFYVVIYFAGGVFNFSSFSGIWIWLFALFPLVFITAIGAFIGSWIGAARNAMKKDVSVSGVK